VYFWRINIIYRVPWLGGDPLFFSCLDDLYILEGIMQDFEEHSALKDGYEDPNAIIYGKEGSRRILAFSLTMFYWRLLIISLK
jgi:hypothetical protein